MKTEQENESNKLIESLTTKKQKTMSNLIEGVQNKQVH